MASIITVAIELEHDVVLARQRARQMAGLLAFDPQDQVRIATAVSEIARNVFRYAKKGKVEFSLAANAPALQIKVTDEGPGISNLKEILRGKYVSKTGMGLGILGARRLMDDFTIESRPGGGTTVVLRKDLPKKSPVLQGMSIGQIAAEMAKQPPQDPFEEMQRQNQDLLATLAELQRQKAELAELNQELEDTNRGVVALYAELDERADYLRRASELKSQFLSNMTHEFRTPLNSILSLSRILLDRSDGELTAEQEKQVRFIERGARDLSELVNDLLDLAKVEAGKVKLAPAKFRVQDLFGSLRGMLRPLLAHNSSVSLAFTDAAEMPPLETDESKVSQILRNLISNALKYTDHGEVRVSASADESGVASFSVADTGIGIARADQERIFEEFTQVEGPHQKGKRGTGLGLPLSRKLAELLGGSLSVQSEPGAGSTFILRIPVRYQGETEVSVAPELPKLRDPTRLPVLVIEDNRETLFVYDKYLKGTGFQVVPASTLEKAREALGKFRPVAIILDILLSHENSWDLLVDLKSNADTRRIPVFVITMVENEHKALALGADAFHSKPIDRHWLLEQLSKVVPKKREEILLVDDDEASRYVLAGFLSNTRFRIIEAGSGTQGLRIARRTKPAVIFLDLIMPDMNGFQVLDELKSNSATMDLPVIVHTGKKLSSAECRTLEAQTAGVLVKGKLDRELVINSIQRALEKRAEAADPPIQ